MDVFRLADGRDLDYGEVGDPSGRPVVHLHDGPPRLGREHCLRMLPVAGEYGR